MPVLEEIQKEIFALPVDDQVKLFKWFSLLDKKIWDQLQAKKRNSLVLDWFSRRLQYPHEQVVQSVIPDFGSD